VRGQNVVITCDADGCNLSGAPAVSIHYGINNWTPAALTDPQNAPTIWDNNDSNDWHIPTVEAPQAAEPKAWMVH